MCTIYSFKSICVYTHIFVCIYMYIHILMCVCMYMYIYIYIYLFISYSGVCRPNRSLGRKTAILGSWVCFFGSGVKAFNNY